MPAGEFASLGDVYGGKGDREHCGAHCLQRVRLLLCRGNDAASQAASGAFGGNFIIEGDIRYLRSSLPEAFAAAAVRTGAFAEFFRSVARQLGGFCTASVEEAFSIASKGCLKDTALTKQDISMLVKLGGMLGKMDADMQLNALEWYLEQLEGLTDTLDRENKKRALLSKSLGILAGIFLLVILL